MILFIIVLLKTKVLSFHMRAVYTGIKKPEFFSHSGFSLEVARQLQCTPKHWKKPELKNPPLKCGFMKLHRFFTGFLPIDVNARSPLASIIRVFGHVGRDLPRNHPRPATYCGNCALRIRSKVERSSACALLIKKPVWDSGFLAVYKTVQQKTQFFLDFGFCQCKWAYYAHYIFTRIT